MEPIGETLRFIGVLGFFAGNVFLFFKRRYR